MNDRLGLVLFIALVFCLFSDVDAQDRAFTFSRDFDLTPANGIWNTGTTDGRWGFQLEVVDENLIVSVFSYDTDGAQQWLFGAGVYDAENTVVELTTTRDGYGFLSDSGGAGVSEFVGTSLRFKFLNDRTGQVTVGDRVLPIFKAGGRDPFIGGFQVQIELRVVNDEPEEYDLPVNSSENYSAFVQLSRTGTYSHSGRDYIDHCMAIRGFDAQGVEVIRQFHFLYDGVETLIVVDGGDKMPTFTLKTGEVYVGQATYRLDPISDSIGFGLSNSNVFMIPASRRLPGVGEQPDIVGCS